MPLVAASRKQSRRVRFPASKERATRTRLATSKLFRSQDCASKQQVAQDPRGVNYIQDTSLGNNTIEMTTSSQQREQFDIPPLFKELPVIRDLLMTESSRVQDETVEICLPFLSTTEPGLQSSELNRSGVPKLLKNDHLEYLFDSLEDYPSNFVGIDASRPWMVYWALAGLTLLGEDLTSYRER
jgi:protein farnesyltransferase subunit beta